MSIVSQTYHGKLLHLVYDDAAVAPQRYIIWFEGREHVVTTEDLESPASVWQRVLGWIEQSRMEIHRSYLGGREFAHATVYAGILPTAEQRRGHIREHLVHILLEIASPVNTPDSASRVRAAMAAGELLGMLPTKKRQMIPAHEMLKAVRDERIRRENSAESRGAEVKQTDPR